MSNRCCKPRKYTRQTKQYEYTKHLYIQLPYFSGFRHYISLSNPTPQYAQDPKTDQRPVLTYLRIESLDAPLPTYNTRYCPDPPTRTSCLGPHPRTPFRAPVCHAYQGTSPHRLEIAETIKYRETCSRICSAVMARQVASLHRPLAPSSPH